MSQVLAALRNALKPADIGASVGGTFANWCALNNLPAVPALPATVARFISDCQGLGMDKLWPAVCEISGDHVSRGLADPTAGGMAAGAINAIAKIDAPRSWPAPAKSRFFALPYDLQIFFAEHETRREKEIRRAHNEAAKARQATIQQPKKVTDGNQPNPAA